MNQIPSTTWSHANTDAHRSAGAVDYLAAAQIMRTLAAADLIVTTAHDLGAFFGRVGRALAAWARRRATYRELESLDDRTLADIGLTRYDLSAFAAGKADLPARDAALKARHVGAVAVLDFPAKTVADHRAADIAARHETGTADPRRAA